MKKLFKKVAGFAALALAALVPSMSASAATIYLDASAAGWTSANLHYWGNGNGDITGEQVTGKSNFFKFTNVPDNQNGSFLFQTQINEWGNDNASKDASQVNVTFTDGHVYKLTAQDGRWKFQDNIFYLYCKLADYSNWDFDNPKATFAFNPDNGYYEAKVTTKAGNNGNYFFISTLNKGNDRSWDSHNNNRYTTGDGDKNPIGTWQTAKIANSVSYLVNGAYTDLLFQFDLDKGQVRAITEVTPPTPTNIKVICKNTAKWDNVKISYWGDGQSAKTYDMTKSSDDLWEYTISETWTPTGFTFSDGKGNKYKYNQAPVNGNTYTNGEYVEPEPGKGIRVRLKDEANWGSVKIHYWEKNSSGKLLHETTWPGVDMTKVGSYFEYTITDDWTPTGFIFVKGSDSNTKVSSENAGPVDGKIYTNKNSNLSEYSVPMPSSMTLYYTTDHNNDNAQWGYQGMTKEGNKFVCTVKKVEKSKDFHFHFVSNTDDTYVCNSSNNENLYTDGDGRELKYQIKNSDNKSYDFKYYFGDSEADLIFEIDFENEVVIVTRDGYVAPDYNYYLLGDVNNWMNDGTYKINVNGKEKEYGYGYSKAENGVRADYQFVTTKINGSNNWYVLDLEKATNGRLWGQFTIIQDNGCFKAAEKEENQNDGRDVINWKGSYAQWANQYDREKATDSYKAETLKAYQSVDVAVADLNRVSQAVKGNRSNFHLDHNLYKGVKIYFNPTDQKIFMTYSDYQDFYIYLSTDADRNDNDLHPANKYVGIIKESMNSVNYTVNFKDFAVDSQTGTAMTLCEDEQQFPNGLVYTKYWKIKIPNGIEGPAGQKFNVNIKGSKGYGDSKYSTIFLNDLYIIDGLKAFAKAEDQTVESVQYRLYGYPADGDVNNLVIIDTKTGEEKPASAAGSEYGWETLKHGEYSYHPNSTSWWHTGEAESIIKEGFTPITDGFYPDIKDSSSSTKEYYSIPAEHAMKFIQWRIIYNGSQKVQGMRKAAGEKRLVPETLTVDRSNPNADWVLNGTHKEIMAGIATGVEDIEVEDAEISEEGEAVAPVYYNLQGVRVAEPQHGLYIKVTGNKSEKILVK